MDEKVFQKVVFLEEEIEKLKERNKKVDRDKKWETSAERKFIIIIVTYILMCIVFFVL